MDGHSGNQRKPRFLNAGSRQFISPGDAAYAKAFRAQRQAFGQHPPMFDIPAAPPHNTNCAVQAARPAKDFPTGCLFEPKHSGTSPEDDADWPAVGFVN
jgi:hypothetical protein